MHCQFNHDLDLDKAVNFEGFPCGVELNPDGTVKQANKTKAVFSPGGTATLICQFKANAE